MYMLHFQLIFTDRIASIAISHPKFQVKFEGRHFALNLCLIKFEILFNWKLEISLSFITSSVAALCIDAGETEVVND